MSEKLEFLFDNVPSETNQISSTSILSLFETTREQRKSFVEDVVNKLENEEVDPLKIHLQVKMMEDIIEMLTCTDENKNKSPWFAATYKKLLLEAAEKHGKKFELYNAKFSIGEVGTKYDYSKCGDPVIHDLLLHQKEVNEAVKERKAFLNTITKPIGVLIGDIEDGEMVTIYPPAKSSTTAVTVSLK